MIIIDTWLSKLDLFLLFILLIIMLIITDIGLLVIPDGWIMVVITGLRTSGLYLT
jgi:hypothetical protein